jgi:hypothetical protein
MKTNREGLTYQEWLAAAQVFQLSEETPQALYRAWKAGEDPTEHAAETFWKNEGSK